MSPENDQCRWVGIRPVNPPEDIPVTLDAEVVHVIVDSGGGGDSTPGKVMNSYQTLAAVLINVWNTTLDVNPGAGYLNWLGFYYAAVTLNPWHIRFTIDGVVGDVIVMDTLNYGFCKDYTQVRGKHLFMPFGTVRFNSQLKVEAMSNSGGAACMMNIGYTIDNP